MTMLFDSEYRMRLKFDITIAYSNNAMTKNATVFCHSLKRIEKFPRFYLDLRLSHSK